MNNKKKYFLHKAEQFYKELVENILPFWYDNGYDKEFGGILTCLGRNGELMDTDKSVWFQGRAAWVYLYAYNNIDKNPKWLELGKSCVEFIDKFCYDVDGRMFYQVTRQGVPVRKRRYAFSETFASIAYAQYAIAVNDQRYAEKAVALLEKVFGLLASGTLEPKFIEEGFSAKGHSVCMIMINTAYCIREAIDEPILTKRIDNAIAELRKDFIKPDFKTILETVGPNGEFIDSIAGRTINPGHSIETGWFIIEEGIYRNNNNELIELGSQIVDWAWNWGWDATRGGMQYFKDCKGYPVQEYWHDMKFWWPQNEAVIANLYAYKTTKDEKYLERFELANNYQFEYLKDNAAGEWFGYLHYDNSVSQEAKGNLYKGPFHIPRMLMKCYQLCQELAEE